MLIHPDARSISGKDGASKAGLVKSCKATAGSKNLFVRLYLRAQRAVRLASVRDVGRVVAR